MSPQNYKKLKRRCLSTTPSVFRFYEQKKNTFEWMIFSQFSTNLRSTKSPRLSFLHKSANEECPITTSFHMTNHFGQNASNHNGKLSTYCFMKITIRRHRISDINTTIIITLCHIERWQKNTKKELMKYYYVPSFQIQVWYTLLRSNDTQ